LAPSFDTVGFFARDLDVLSKVGSVLLACDISPPRDLGTINFLTDAFELADPDVRQALEDPVERMKRSYPGKTRDISFADYGEGSPAMNLQDWYHTYCQIQWAEIWSCLGSWVTESNPEFGPRTKMNFELVKTFDRETVVGAMRRRETYYRLLKKLLGEEDLICIPTTPAVAPLKGSLGVDRRTGDYYPRTLALTAIAGMGRLPQVTLPVGNVGGIPAGLSLIAPERTDGFLLGAARVLQTKCEWSE
jgi:amidase